ncbi:MAG: ABC transporter ATP-binding protein [Methanomassiliicoccales archaeon]|nr:ABC transporter ATP-binding protein [Methanomassiliicoccales archaeon]
MNGDASITAVETKGLRKEYDGLVAVEALDLRIERGTLYGLIGPNGSGKTTTIKMLVNLLVPTRGEAFVLQQKVPGQDLRRIGYMPQDMAIYPDLTVSENLEFFAGLYGVSGERFTRREAEIIKVVDLADRKDSLVQELSGGMRHRVSLGCALIHEPELLFLDEPTIGVDPELRVGFWAFFRELATKGKTVVLTTHYMDEAARCDIVGMMRTGRMIAEGTPKELMEASGTPNLEDAFLEFSRRHDDGC